MRPAEDLPFCSQSTLRCDDEARAVAAAADTVVERLQYYVEIPEEKVIGKLDEVLEKLNQQNRSI